MTDRAKYWQRMLTAWEASGLTQAEFCRRRGLEAVTFAWWKGQLPGPSKRGSRGQRSRGRGNADSGRGTTSFVEVALTVANPKQDAEPYLSVAPGDQVEPPKGVCLRCSVVVQERGVLAELLDAFKQPGFDHRFGQIENEGNLGVGKILGVTQAKGFALGRR